MKKLWVEGTKENRERSLVLLRKHYLAEEEVLKLDAAALHVAVI